MSWWKSTAPSVILWLVSMESLSLSTEFMTVSSDFAAFFDAKPEQVIDAMASATRGEYDALQRYLPTISAARIENEKMVVQKESLVPLTEEQAKVQAILNIAYQDGGAAIGAYVRESDNLGTAITRFGTYMTDAKAAFGTGIVEPFSESAGTLDETGESMVRFADTAGQAFGTLASQEAKRSIALEGLSSDLSIAEKAQHNWNLALASADMLLPGVSLVTDRFRFDVQNAGDATTETAEAFNAFPYYEFRRGMAGAAGAVDVMNKSLYTTSEYSRSDFLDRIGDDVVRLKSKWYDLAEQIRRANAQLKGHTGRYDQGYYGDRVFSGMSVNVNFNGVVGDPVEVGREVQTVLSAYAGARGGL